MPSSGLCIYDSKDVTTRGYFAKPKGIRERKGLKKKLVI